MSKAYEPGAHEDAIYASWEASGFFNPDNLPGNRKESFSIVMPPPNVTGTLHVGHAVMLALEDLMIRFNRMRGKLVLWIPGTDHAAIATQTKVEKELAKKGASKQSLGREKFLEEVKKFAEESKSTIRNQIRKMGSSCDWSREAYTLDGARTLAVRTVFKMMYEDGLIYQGFRIVNWCPRCQSTLADDEVEHREEKGKLYYIKYNLGKDGTIIVATTRPETKLGDTAIAVNPNDARYKGFVGKEYDIQLAFNKIHIKVIADKRIDPNFGTGAVGVTPAHSFTDYDLAKRHNLYMVQVIDKEGKIQLGLPQELEKENDFEIKSGLYADVYRAPDFPREKRYDGYSIDDARKRFIEDLRTQGLLEKEEEIVHNIGICYRCGETVEPLPSRQWFIDVSKKVTVKGNKYFKNKSLKEVALQVVKKKDIKIIPNRFEKVYYHWIENLHDWCISRQIWFGHQIPVWYGIEQLNRPGILRRTGKIYVGVEHPKGDGWEQDTDTLDTWFSSGLWTFSTLGWPKSGIRNKESGMRVSDLESFHPTSVLETGYDILFFWIARMILMTTYALGEVPFRTVYLHGLVRDEQGRKMSKSLGNIIDPLDVAAKYGTDAVRLSLVIGTSPGGDSRIWDKKIAGFRNFTNKLWNISRYILGVVGNDKKLQATPHQSKLGTGQASYKLQAKTLADKWILSRLGEVSKSVTSKIEKFEFSSAGEELRDFTWNELADWYLEISKIQLTAYSLQLTVNTKKILLYLLKNVLKLWHPFMPFVTEAVWRGAFAGGEEDFLMVQDWPKLKVKKDAKAEADFRLVQEIVTAIRNIRSEQEIPPKNPVNVTIQAGTVYLKLIQENESIIKSLATIEKLNIGKEKGPEFKGAIKKSIGPFLVFVHILEQNLDVHRRNLEIELRQATEYYDMVKRKLDNKSFVTRAPKEVVEAERVKLEETRLKIEKIKESLK